MTWRGEGATPFDDDDDGGALTLTCQPTAHSLTRGAVPWGMSAAVTLKGGGDDLDDDGGDDGGGLMTLPTAH